ncbi:hypothetical protein GQ42DRAFT_158786 [Ramicandelaber brevisporus]|nr:hypothetical protein GQ42DRAFT_158786 [Ramicandelaber brevisporus]
MKSTESNQLQLLPYPPPLGWTLESSSILDANARSSVSPQLSFTSPADARSSASPQPSVTEPADTQSSISSPLMPDVNTVALRNNSSGMRFILSNSGSSIVHCTIIVPTAAATNHCAPHAVEHMVFQGSVKLPKPGSLFKVSAHLGIIDFGAVTHQDCTIYYYTAVDAKSAIVFVPILIESLRRPQFNHNSYLSEIHHVRSNGDAAGVMHSEILEKMDSKSDVRDVVRRFLSPPGSPYHFSGGRDINDIQRLTYNETTRCHAEYYHPQFFNCIITGAGVTARALFDTMNDSLNDLSTANESTTVSALPRPLHIPKWPLGAKSLEYRMVKYPSRGDPNETNEMSYHSFGIALDDNTTIKGVETLLLCLTSPGGPLYNAFCTTDFGNSQQPWSSNVDWGMVNYELMEYYIHLIDVNADLIEEEPTPESFEKSVVHSRLRKVFEHVYNHGFSRPFIDGTNPTKKAGWNEADLNYIRGFLSASMVSDDDAQDEQPFSKTYHNKIVDGIRRHQLYDFSPSEVSLRSKNERIDLNKLSSPIDDITLSGKLMKEGIKFWRGLFKDYIRSANWLAMLAYPDESLASELDNQPQQLVEKRHSGVITESMPDYLDKSTSVGDLSKHHEVLINAMQTSKQPFSSKDYKNWPSPPSNATEIHLPATLSQFIRIADLPQSRKQLQKLASLQHQLPVRGVVITATESNTSCIDLKLPLHGLSRRSAAYIDLLVVCIMNSNTFVHSGSITDSDTDFHIDICRSSTSHELTLDLHAEFTLGNQASSNVTSASSSSYSQNAASYPTAIHTLFNRFINSVFSNDSVHGALDSISGKSIDDDPTDVAFNRLLMSTTPPSADSLDSELFASTNATEPVSHHSLYGNGSFNSYLAPFAQKSFAAALDKLLSTGNSKKGLGLICSRLNEARESIFALNGLNACDFPVYCDDGNINGSVKARIPGVLHIGIGTMDSNPSTIDQIGKEIAYEACRQWNQALSKYLVSTIS